MRVRAFDYLFFNYQINVAVMRKTIYVVTYGNQWKVRCDHCGEGTSSTQADAIKIAKKHVASLPAGALSQIVIQGKDSLFRTEWTYGKDPFPPRG